MTVETPDAGDPGARRATREAGRQPIVHLLLPGTSGRIAAVHGEIIRPVDLEPLIAVAKRLRSERDWRASCFGRLQFYEPAWDLMLHLFIAGEKCESVDLDEACRLVSMGRSAGARWIGSLETRGLVQIDDVSAGHDAQLTLSGRGRTMMADYLSALR